MTTTSLDIALSYIARGLGARSDRVPGEGTQGAFVAEWQTLRIGADDAPQYFNGAEQNIGVILGDASHGLTDIDLDCDEAVRAAAYILPKTRMLWAGVETRKPLALCYRPVAERDQGQAGLR